MQKELRDRIRQMTESSVIEKPDFIELLRLLNEHYDRMQANATQSLIVATPLEAIFDSVSDALLSGEPWVATSWTEEELSMAEGLVSTKYGVDSWNLYL